MFVNMCTFTHAICGRSFANEMNGACICTYIHTYLSIMYNALTYVHKTLLHKFKPASYSSTLVIKVV